MRAIQTLILTLALAGTAATAQAMDVTVTYAIGGGNFNGLYSEGPVTGGTLQILYPDANSLFSATQGAYLLGLTLTGPSGYFRVANHEGIFITQNPPFIPDALLSHSDEFVRTGLFPYPDINGPYLTIISGGQGLVGHVTLGIEAWGQAKQPRSTLQVDVWTALAKHTGSFWPHTAGGEISRVPEPGTGSLLLFGLVGLAGAGGVRRFLRHR